MSTVRNRVDRWIKPYAALWLTMAIGGTLVVTMALLGAEVYSDVVDDEGLASMDIPALHFAQSLRTPGIDAFVTGFTNIGGGIGMPILASILTAWLTFLSRSWRPLLLVGGAAAVSTTATTLGKRLVGRTRPDHADAVPPYEDSPSFPSGHTLNTTVVIGVIVYIICLQFHVLSARITAITAGTVFIIAMGLSRVFLGHHWLTDVIAGWTLGLAWVGCVILAHRLFHLTRRKEHAGPAPTFEHPVVRDVVADAMHHEGRHQDAKHDAGSTHDGSNHAGLNHAGSNHAGSNHAGSNHDGGARHGRGGDAGTRPGASRDQSRQDGGGAARTRGGGSGVGHQGGSRGRRPEDGAGDNGGNSAG